MSLDPEVRRGGNLPFGMVASVWMCDPRYSTNARTLYAILVTYADTQSRDTKRGKPYRPELAAQLGVSVSTVDRTLAEMEAAGMVRIQKRKDPDNPANNDASVYHLHDFPLMYAGNGEWTDPLPAGVKAADVAKRLIEERRTAKREAGEERRGGVPKGVNPMAVRAAKAAGKAEVGEEGGSMGAATPSSTHAARVAAPVLPNIQSPVQSPSPDPDAPAARSAPDAGGNPSGSRRRGNGGVAASEKGRNRLTKREYEAIAAVRELLPDDLNKALPAKTPPKLSAAIIESLAIGAPYERTPAQLVEHRVMRRWNGYWAARFYAGQLSSVVGPTVAMLEFRPECGDISCEDRVNIHTGLPCAACAERVAGARADREVGAPPAPTADVPPPRGAGRPQCPECERPLASGSAPVLCRDCRG